jgi:hypothetical protein
VSTWIDGRPHRFRRVAGPAPLRLTAPEWIRTERRVPGACACAPARQPRRLSHLWCAGCRERAENGGGTVPVRPCLSVRLLSPVPLSGCLFLLVCPFPLGRAHARGTRVFSTLPTTKGMFSFLKKSLYKLLFSKKTRPQENGSATVACAVWQFRCFI